jgi:AraC family transcriptional regulator
LRRIEERVRADGPTPTLSELAALCGMSPRHLRRAYRQQTGRGLSDLVTEVRTSRAADLLASDGVSLKEISHRLGFAHLSGFSTAFRRATGESPGAYRARLWSERRWVRSAKC